MKYLLFALPILFAMKCESTSVASRTSLTGEWFIREVFLGDVIDTPCGYEAVNAPKFTINFTESADAENRFSFSGVAAVNNFFGNYQVTAFDKSSGVGTIAFGQIGMTKMAGPPELMACESRFFDLLNRSTDFSITTENGKEILRLGVFKKDDKPSRDGGTFFIMERL